MRCRDAFVPGGGLAILKDRDQRSRVFLNDPKQYLPTERKPKENTFQKVKP